MEAKLKAEELVCKYYRLFNNFPNYQYVIENLNTIQDEKLYTTKQCALIAVDEMINTCNKFYDKLSYPADVLNDMGYVHFKREREYLLEVKKEIENL